jgi:hypothetical protein
VIYCYPIFYKHYVIVLYCYSLPYPIPVVFWCVDQRPLTWLDEGSGGRSLLCPAAAAAGWTGGATPTPKTAIGAVAGGGKTPKEIEEVDPAE